MDQPAEPHRFDLEAIGAGLVVSAFQRQLEDALDTGSMVVTAAPGTGKTTVVPPLTANALAQTHGGRVLVTQPRRVAVRAAARRIAQLDGSRVGGAVGYTVRGEHRAGPETRLEAVTPGVLLRRLLADPGLDGIAGVILDEVHERTVETDLLLALLAEVRALREDFVLVAMSATLNAEAVAALIGGVSSETASPIVAIPSKLHPLEVCWRPFSGSRLDERGVNRAFLEHVANITLQAQAEARSDALVFVPAAADVDATVRFLRQVSDRTPDPPEVLPLHGRLSSVEQDRAVSGGRPGEAHRIIVSTAIAESSLTVPGVRLVIDSGLDRQVRRDRARDMAGLVTVSASRASASQRAGRAAREGPGRVIRVYSESDYASMPVEAPPEIRSADLTDAALTLAVWGTPEGRGLRLLTDPPAAAVREGVRALRTLGLIDEAGEPTDLGVRVSKLPLGARESRALLAGADRLGSPRVAAEILAAVSSDARDPGADLGRLLMALRSGASPASKRWSADVRRLRRAAETGDSVLERDGSHPEPAFAPGVVLALARPEWIARRTTPHARTYLLASGTRAALPEGSSLLGFDWIAISDVQRFTGRAAEGTGAVIRLAAGLDEATARHLGERLLSSERVARVVDSRVRVREDEHLGAILIASRPVAARAGETTRTFAAHLRSVGLADLFRVDAVRSLRSRLALLHRVFGEPWPAVDEQALLERLDAWLEPELAMLPEGAPLSRVDAASGLRRLLPWPAAGRLDELVPERVTVPSGRAVSIAYPDAESPDDPPVVAVKLQELFGLAETPRIADGRVPVVFHLLSPAGRPLAVTADLPSFWAGPYQEVRREMRGRYPKHPWPEDPWTAVATARTARKTRR